MNVGESLEVSYNDYYEEKDIELGNLEVVALTDKRPLGVSTGISRRNNDDCFRGDICTTEQS